MTTEKSTKAVAKSDKHQALAAKDRHDALVSMNEPLRAKFEQLERKFKEVNSRDVLLRYDIGREVNAVMANEKKYGENARGLLAAGLTISVQELGCYQAIAKAWTKEEVDEMLKIADASGWTNFGYTHLTHLARLENAAERKALTKLCLKEMLTARELQHQVQGLSLNRREAGGKTRRAPKTPHAGLLQITKFTTDVANFEPLAMKHVFDAMDGYSPAEWDASLVKELERAEKSVEASEQALRHMRQRLTAALRSGQNALELRKNKRLARETLEASVVPVTEVDRLQANRKLDRSKKPHGERSVAAASQFLPIPAEGKKAKIKQTVAKAKAKALAVGD